MSSDYLVLALVIFVMGFILFRILTLRLWMRYNIHMKKGSGGRFDTSDASFKEYERRQARAASTKKHKIALRRAKYPKFK